MATTAQDVINRAKAFNPLNTSLTADTVELLTRIQQIQQRVFTSVAKLNSPRLSVSVSANSTNAASARVVDLSALAQRVERLIRVGLGSTTEILPVSEIDTASQLAPRYFIRGQSLIEVGSDWSASSGVVSVTLLYAYGATAITPTGATSQAVSVPDEFADVLILPLARYLHQKDPGRDSGESERLAGDYKEAWGMFMLYLTNYDGDRDRSQLLPAPPES